ncbi:MAG TPA: SRPBCC family protein [Rhizobacter sp.]|nr:SRPBCC family protein [Rhizobacter sp.]
MTHTLKVTTPSDNELRLTRSFDAPRQLVFDCWTKPELVRRWMTGPDGWSFVVCEIDLRVGGQYRYVWRNTAGTDMGMRGTYREIVVPERLVSNELFDEDWTGGETRCTVVFTQQGNTTTATTTVLYASMEARNGAMQSGMEHGMAAGFDRLESMLSSLA